MKNTRKILINTGVMYLKMSITIVLSLYTSRVVLDALGIIDFGLYSVVASVVAMFGFLNASMIASVQRHLAFEIGKNNLLAVRKIFNAGLVIHICIAIAVFILAESIGLWFVKNHLTIPVDRMEVAVWAFHFSMLSFMCNIISVPFQSILNAKECMVVIAIVGVVESALQLAIAFMIKDSHFDKLKLYAILMFFVFFVSLLVYCIVCYLKYKECKPLIVRDKSLYKELTGFAGWNLFGTLSAAGKTQGIVILLNIFLGPAINAAYAVANRVNSQLSFFSSSVTKAISPQIVKNFGAGNRDEFMALVFQSSKFTFYMLYIVALPILLEADLILNLWLKIVPDYAVLFCRLIIINSLIDSFSAALVDAALATGKIRNYQIVVGSFIMLTVPLSYVALKSGASPYTVLLISIMISLAATAVRLGFLNRMIEFPVMNYIREVVMPLMIIVLVTLICTLPVILRFEESISRLAVMLIVSVVANVMAIYLIGLKSNERNYIKNVVRRYI
jgi:O-antigen/teichoic acid export membrane protein